MNRLYLCLVLDRAGLLDLDARNNSVWNHRWFVVSRTTEVRQPSSVRHVLLPCLVLCDGYRGQCRYIRVVFVLQLSLEERRSELAVAMTHLESILENESAWNYARGLTRGHAWTEFPALLAWLERQHQTERGYDSPSLQSFRVDVLQETGRKPEAIEVRERNSC